MDLESNENKNTKKWEYCPENIEDFPCWYRLLIILGLGGIFALGMFGLVHYYMYIDGEITEKVDACESTIPSQLIGTNITSCNTHDVVCEFIADNRNYSCTVNYEGVCRTGDIIYIYKSEDNHSCAMTKDTSTDCSHAGLRIAFWFSLVVIFAVISFPTCIPVYVIFENYVGS